METGLGGDHKLKLTREQAESCESIKFKGGQILIHEDEDKTIVEIHTELGWRMGKFSNPFRDIRGSGGANSGLRSDARVALQYDEKVYVRDKNLVEFGAARRKRAKIETLMDKGQNAGA